MKFPNDNKDVGFWDQIDWDKSAHQETQKEKIIMIRRWFLQIKFLLLGKLRCNAVIEVI